VSYPEGRNIWYKHGLLHRADGPAVVRVDGTVNWKYDGDTMGPIRFRETIIKLAEQLFDIPLQEIKELPFSEIKSIVYAFNAWKDH
jgi:hypothetical protein